MAVLAAGLIVITGRADNIIGLFRPAISIDAAQPKDISPGQDGSVTVSGQAVPRNISATAVDPGPLNDTAYPFKTALQPDENGVIAVEAASPLYDIGPHGPLKAPMDISFRLQRPLRDGEALRVMSSPSDQPGTWSTAPYVLSPDRSAATITVDHLSLFQLMITVGAALEAIKNAPAFSEAKSPSCTNTEAALQDGYAVKVTGKDAVLTCLDKGDDGVRTFKVVNNRRYALEYAAEGMERIAPSSFEATFSRLYKTDHRIIMPREAVDFRLNDLPAGGKATFSVRLTNIGATLGFIDGYFDSVTMAVTKKKLLGEEKSKKLEILLTAKSCATFLDGKPANGSDLLTNCFTDSALEAVFGPAGLLFGPVLAILGQAEANRSVINAFGDNRNGRDKTSVTISRKKSGIPDEFIGEWFRHITSLTIAANGSAISKEGVYVGGCPEISETEYCSYNSKLQLKQSNGKVTGTYTDVWLTLGESNERYEMPISYYETTEKAGDQVEINIDQYGQLLFKGLGRLAKITDSDNDGQPDHGWQFCNDRTDPSNNECGA